MLVRIPSRAWLYVPCNRWILSLRRADPRPEELYRVCVCVCVCVSLSVIRCNNCTRHLQWAGRRGQTKKERKNTRISDMSLYWKQGNSFDIIIRPWAEWPGNRGSPSSSGTYFSSLCFLQNDFGSHIESYPMRPAFLPPRHCCQVLSWLFTYLMLRWGMHRSVALLVRTSVRSNA